MSEMLLRLRGLSQRPETSAVAVALALKGLGSVLAFAMLAIAARAMGADAFGTFTIWFSALLFLAVTAVFGQETILMRDWGRNVAARDYDRARTDLRHAMRVTLVLPLAAAGLVVVAAAATGQDGTFIACAAIFVVLASYLIVSSHAARTLVGLAQGDLHGEITWRLVVIAAAGAALLQQKSLSAAELLGWAAAGIALSLAFHVVSLRRALAGLPGRAGALRDIADWASRSARLWAGGVLEGANQYMEVFLIGLTLGPREAGLYFAASRLANVFAIIGTGLHNYSTREIARLQGVDDRGQLRRSLRLVSGVTAFLIAGGFGLMLIAGKPLLSLFGPAFTDGYLALMVLSVGAAVTALGGPAPAVLRLTGNEGLYTRLLAGFVLARAVAVVLLASSFGLLGAALASAACACACAIAVNHACRTRVAVDPAVTIFLTGQERPAR
ncbi:lipopolysaccharide biosynthesis protein [Methylobacterium iners]|nr:lipopolysaccharide biosynthesis protein [Methylobacterium iners]